MTTPELKIEKLQLVTVPKGEYKDIVAFQLIEYSLMFFGNMVTNTLDTKILKDGRQIVVNGDGFIKSGTEIA